MGGKSSVAVALDRGEVPGDHRILEFEEDPGPFAAFSDKTKTSRCPGRLKHRSASLRLERQTKEIGRERERERDRERVRHRGRETEADLAQNEPFEKESVDSHDLANRLYRRAEVIEARIHRENAVPSTWCAQKQK